MGGENHFGPIWGVAMKNFRIVVRIVAGIVAGFIGLVFLFGVFVLLKWMTVRYFVIGKMGPVDSIFIKSNGKEMSFNDKESMEYFEMSFKTLDNRWWPDGISCEAWIGYKYYPSVYGVIYMDGKDADYGYIRIDGSTRSLYKFKLPKPQPEGVKRILEFMTNGQSQDPDRERDKGIFSD